MKGSAVVFNCDSGIAPCILVMQAPETRAGLPLSVERSLTAAALAGLLWAGQAPNAVAGERNGRELASWTRGPADVISRLASKDALAERGNSMFRAPVFLCKV
jgi:hypothetical protein